MLNVKYFPGNHTGAEIGNIIAILRETWNINEIILHLIIKDGTANIKKGCIDAGVKSMTCIIHTVQLPIKVKVKIQKFREWPVATGHD